MKSFLILFLFISSISFSQHYTLLPDTCTYCSFYQNPAGPSNYLSWYDLNPELDTNYNGNDYMQVPFSQEAYSGAQIFAMRQVGDKVFGVAVGDTQEYLIQDWEAQVGDTLFNLYSNRTYYDAVYIGEDSMILNDGSYHHYREMQGIGYAPNGNYQTETWTFYWHERGLCAEHVAPTFANSGGLMYNLPGTLYGSISTIYYLPKAHTADWRYDLGAYVDSCEFAGTTSSLFENNLETILIHPNPTSGMIHLGEINFEVVKIQILDMKGQLLLNTNTKLSSIDISSFDNGIYFLRIQSSDGTTYPSKISKVD